jgi:hypothetical protein
MTCPSLPSLTRWWAAMERLGDFLDRIEQGFDWSAFEALLSRLGDGRAPGYPPLTMFKIVLLQQWHTLSDPAAEEAVRDRLSFRPFGCLPLDMETPDHASICGFARRSTSSGFRLRYWPKSTGSPTRAAWSSSAARWSTRPSSPRSEAPLPERRRQSARPRGSRASATRPISATKRIWRWTKAAVLCGRPR